MLRAPDVARLLGAAVLARMPIGIDSLAHGPLRARRDGLVRARRTSSAAAFGLGVGCSAPALGRLIDRHGHAGVMLPLAGLHAVALCGARRPGARRGARRRRWSRAASRPASPSRPWARSSGRCWPACWPTTPGLLPTAYALDGIAIELVFVAGPLLTAAIVVVASPAVALLVAVRLRPTGHRRARHVAGLARLAAGRPRPRAPPARRAGLARRAHHRRRDGPRRLRAGRHRGDDDRLRRPTTARARRPAR